MHLHFSRPSPNNLVVELIEGETSTTVSVADAKRGIESLSRALDTAVTTGYGECFWPALEGGQYWWMFRREADTLEVVAMWSRGGASGWQHVFRAVDAAAWIAELVAGEAARVGFPVLG